ncbi:MAG: hypothetical protein AAF282_03660 [Cyanobacteria bacterium P01_A01_bin.15]
MSNDTNHQGRGRRDSEDQARDRTVYRYVLSLSDLGLTGRTPIPNETGIAKQWGTDRIFVRRVLRSVLYEKFYQKKKEDRPPVPGLTLAKLVGILVALETHQREQQALSSEGPLTSIITHSEKVKALRLFGQLSSEERAALGLPVHPGQSVLDQLVDKATDRSADVTADHVTRLYNFFLQGAGRGKDWRLSDALKNSDKTTQRDFIHDIVSEYTWQYFAGLTKSGKEDRDCKLVERVERELDRIKLQSGIEQANVFLKQDDDLFKTARLHNHLTVDFIQQLVRSVVDNELLTDEFPIYLKYFEIERVKPLPLYIKQKGLEIGVLNPHFFQDDEDVESARGLERQYAYRVRLHFYIKLPDSYQIKFTDLVVVNRQSGQRRLEFFEEVVGIGSPLNHITTAINRVLLWDIPVLEDYAPVADGIHYHNEVIRGTPNSPVWSHCVARLYKVQDINDAVERDEPCETVATSSETVSADFCGFDLLETSAKAALHARLKLIKATLAHQPDRDANSYIEELCLRVEELTALKRAKHHLNFYPFSLRAMEGQLEKTIFKDKYRLRQPDFSFQEVAPGTRWSIVAFEAQLEIAEGNLKEGLLHIAKQYLEVIRPYFEGDAQGIIGDLLLTRYHLCWFRYYYLSDLDDTTNRVVPDRYMAVRKAEEELEKAQLHLQRRLNKYEKLKELSQSNLHPQFFLLSSIHAHRAKLYMYFSNYTRKLERWETLLEPVKLLEKAKMYAARDGDPALYAQWSAYQSWCYIMLAYLGEQEIYTRQGFSYAECFDWAKRLIDHAVLCYSPTGQACYQQIKDGGGRITPHVCLPDSSSSKKPKKGASITRRVKPKKYYEKYGSTMMQVVPLIQELIQDEEQNSAHGYEEGSHVVNLEMSLLKKYGVDEGRSTYLFGMRSSILLFAKGMLELCQTYPDADGMLRSIREKALRLFTYCSAIASDGTERNESEQPKGAEPDSLILDRAFPDGTIHTGDQLLQCLYPHRLTQFADLGKIFIIVCELILLTASEPVQAHLNSKSSPKTFESFVAKDLQKIRKLILELRENNNFPFPQAQTCGQKRYNGHLAEHYIQFENYVEAFIVRLNSSQIKHSDLMGVRNQLVADTFKIIRGEINVIP